MLKECGFGVAANCSEMQRGETTRYSSSYSSAVSDPGVSAMVYAIAGWRKGD